MNKTVLKLPVHPMFTSTARLHAASLGTLGGFDVEEIEDIKLVVGECMIMAVKDENEEFVLEAELEEGKLRFVSNVDRDKKDDMSIKIMEALCSEVHCSKGRVEVLFEKEK